jgi:methylmalonyl-CoA/ethylmalonyl-CoA epimerase
MEGMKFDHLGVSVPDIEASIKWYHDVLEFNVERQGTLPWVPAKVVHLRRGDMRVELFQVEGSLPLPADRRFPNRDLITHGNKHVAFQVQDIPATTALLRSRGADIAFEYEDRAVFIRDNAGNLIEFVRIRP